MLDGEPRILVTSSLVVVPGWTSLILSCGGRLPRCSTLVAQPAITAALEIVATIETRCRIKTAGPCNIGWHNRCLLKEIGFSPNFLQESLSRGRMVVNGLVRDRAGRSCALAMQQQPTRGPLRKGPRS